MDSIKTSVERDNLFGSEYPQMYDEVTVLSGQTLERGSVIGIVTASGKAKLLDIASSDGSGDFHSVLVADCDASGGDKIAPVAIAGSFQSQALIMGGATTVADIKDAARALNCYLQTSVADNNVQGG